jgi:hypothetical protein
MVGNSFGIVLWGLQWAEAFLKTMQDGDISLFTFYCRALKQRQRAETAAAR